MFNGGLINILFDQPIVFFIVVMALIISFTVHEFAHAKTAELLGDDTARLLGRVTLDPRAHLDPVGTLMILFVGFGWGKPVPFNPINLKNPKRDSAVIAFAGPISNFILAGLFSIPFRFMTTDSFFWVPVITIISYNLVLGAFNLIPVFPLDGFKVVAGLLPPNLHIQWMQMAQYGVFLLIILLFTGSINVIMAPIIELFIKLYGL